MGPTKHVKKTEAKITARYRESKKEKIDKGEARRVTKKASKRVTKRQMKGW